MKYIKYFESIYDNQIYLQNKYCWVIYGDTTPLLEIYQKFIEYIKEKYNITLTTTLENSLKNTRAYEYPLGSYIFYDFNSTPAGNLSYWIFVSTADQNDAKHEMKIKNYLPQGELKIVNNKLILDPTEVIRDKYNV